MVSEPNSNDAVQGDDWMDGLLHEGRASYLDDGGFTARVMDMLPAHAPAWRKPAVAALWGLAVVGAALALPNTAHEIAREGYRMYSAQPLTVPQMFTFIAGAGAAMWAAAAAYTLRSR